MIKAQLRFTASVKEDCIEELQQLCDGLLLADDGESFSIHKVELAKRSNYFYRLFCGKIGQNKKEFQIPGVKGKTLKDIIAFIYCGRLLIHEDNVCDLLIAADYLLLDDLIDYIQSSYIRYNLPINSCVPLFVTAMQINRKDILSLTYRYLQTHFEAVAFSEGSGAGDLPVESLKVLLDDRNIRARDESTVWMAIVKWVQTDVMDRQSLVPELITHLALSDIDDQLASTILDHDLVQRNPACEGICKLRKSQTAGSDLEILSKFIYDCLGSDQSLNPPRFPETIYVVVHYCVFNETDGIHLYVTYDEKIDLWRRVGEVDMCPDFIQSIGHEVYLFKTDENVFLCFDLLEFEWREVAPFRVPRHYYGVVVLSDFIYVMGGISLDGDGLTVVECYDSRDGEWYEVAPMIPVYSFNTAVLDSKIYVVGNNKTSFRYEMTTCFYDPEEDIWQRLPPPSVYRYKFSLIAYRDRLYLIGGRNDHETLKCIEVFDPHKREWAWHRGLPHAYYTPKAMVLRDKLIVYDNHMEDRNYLQTNPGVIWDENIDDWLLFKESSPLNGLYKYTLLVLDDEECLKKISLKNKDPKNVFYRSPFD